MAAVASAAASSALHRFLEDLRAFLAGDVGEQTDPVVTLVEERVGDALKDDSFVLACLEAALTGPRPVRGLIHRDPDDLFTVNLFYWSPGLDTPPHEHRNWTVTGVVMNSIEVRTFTARDGRLVEERTFRSRPRQVGSVRPPCIHRVRNFSRRNSITLHVFGRSSELPDTIWYRGEDIDEASQTPQGRSPEQPMLLRIEATVAAAEGIGGPAAVEFLQRLLPRMGALGRPVIIAALERLGAKVEPELSAPSDPSGRAGSAP